MTELQKTEEMKRCAELKGLLNMNQHFQIGFEKNDGKRYTKSHGYVPVKEQVEQIMALGEKLELQKQGIYDFQDEENYNFDTADPTRKLNFDLTDASEIQRRVKKHVKEYNEAKTKYYTEKRRDIDTTKKVSMGDTLDKSKVSQPNPSEE